jgi:sugar phosphate isomerase/epimerase
VASGDDGLKREKFNLGVVHYVSFPQIITGYGPIVSTLEEILKVDQVQVIEITWINDTEQRSAVREVLHSWDGVVIYSGAPVLAMSQMSLCSLNEELRMDSVNTAKRIIDDACYFGARSVLLISGSDPGWEKRHEARAFLGESLVDLVHYAKRMNDQLTVTLEPADRDIHRRQLIGPISEAVRIVRAVRKHAPNFGLTIDMSHLAQLGEDKTRALSRARGYFHHVHIANAIVRNRDNPRFGDEHPRFGIEEGEHDLESIVEFLRGLNRISFFQEKANHEKPIISIEVKPEKGEDPSSLMSKSIDTFLEACLVA